MYLHQDIHVMYSNIISRKAYYSFGHLIVARSYDQCINFISSRELFVLCVANSSPLRTVGTSFMATLLIYCSMPDTTTPPFFALLVRSLWLQVFSLAPCLMQTPPSLATLVHPSWVQMLLFLVAFCVVLSTYTAEWKLDLYFHHHVCNSLHWLHLTHIPPLTTILVHPPCANCFFLAQCLRHTPPLTAISMHSSMEHYTEHVLWTYGYFFRFSFGISFIVRLWFLYSLSLLRPSFSLLHTDYYLLWYLLLRRADKSSSVCSSSWLDIIYSNITSRRYQGRLCSSVI